MIVLYYIKINNIDVVMDCLNFLYYIKGNNLINFGMLTSTGKTKKIIFNNKKVPFFEKIKNISSFKLITKFPNTNTNIYIDKFKIINYEKKNKCKIPLFKKNEGVTWICANYNNEKIILETLLSIKNQSCNWRCIITDDKSTDNSYNIIKDFISCDKRFTLFKNNKNLGYVNTIKNMVQIANTDIICIVDSDDVLEKEATTEILKAYEKLNCGCVLTNYYWWDPEKSIKVIGVKNFKNMKKIKDYFSPKNILLYCPFEHIRTFRKSITYGLNIFNHLEFKYTEDKDFFYRMEEICDIIFINKPLIKKRITKTSITGQKDTLQLCREFEYKAKKHALFRRNNINTLKLYQQQYYNFNNRENHLKMLNISLENKNEIINSNYDISVIFNKIKSIDHILILGFVFYLKRYFRNSEEEVTYRKELINNIDFCSKNINIDIKYINPLLIIKNYYKQVFNLAYSVYNNKELIKKISDFFIDNFTNKSLCNTKKIIKNDKIKIGFLACRMFNSNTSIYKDRSNIIKNLDRNIYDVIIFTTNEYKKNNILKNQKIIYIPNIMKMIDRILKENVDILFFTEIGIDLSSFVISKYRLAPIQINTIGHSETSGSKFIDYYISSKFFNKPEDQKYFTEKLILLESTGMYYKYPSVISNNININIKSINFSKNIYTCLQTSTKILSYHFINILTKILEKDKKGMIFIIYSSNKEINKIKEIFIKYSQRVMMIPFLTKKDNYNYIIKNSKILIDPYPFGSLNTCLDILNLNKINVVYPSKKINGNFAYGFYKQMNILEPIAYSEDQFVEKCITFMNNDKLRLEIENKIKLKKHVLFESKDSINEYNKILKQIYDNHI